MAPPDPLLSRGCRIASSLGQLRFLNCGHLRGHGAFERDRERGRAWRRCQIAQHAGGPQELLTSVAPSSPHPAAITLSRDWRHRFSTNPPRPGPQELLRAAGVHGLSRLPGEGALSAAAERLSGACAQHAHPPPRHGGRAHDSAPPLSQARARDTTGDGGGGGHAGVSWAGGGGEGAPDAPSRFSVRAGAVQWWVVRKGGGGERAGRDGLSPPFLPLSQSKWSHHFLSFHSCLSLSGLIIVSVVDEFVPHNREINL